MAGFQEGVDPHTDMTGVPVMPEGFTGIRHTWNLSPPHLAEVAIRCSAAYDAAVQMTENDGVADWATCDTALPPNSPTRKHFESLSHTSDRVKLLLFVVATQTDLLDTLVPLAGGMKWRNAVRSAHNARKRAADPDAELSTL